MVGSCYVQEQHAHVMAKVSTLYVHNGMKMQVRFLSWVRPFSSARLELLAHNEVVVGSSPTMATKQKGKYANQCIR